MYSATSLVRVSVPDLDIMPKALVTNQQISSHLKPKPADRINNTPSIIGCSRKLSVLKAPDIIPVSRSHTDILFTAEADDHRLYKQTFQVRSYEACADMTISVDTVLNYLQEAAVNCVRHIGFVGGSGVGRTPEMSKQNLVWVVARTRVVIDQYPTWNDSLQVVAWMNASGRNGCRCNNSIVRDAKTGAILIRASSNWAMMNMNTRRLCKIPDEVRVEKLEPYFYDLSPFVHEDSAKIPKLDNDTADDIFEGLTPKWTDIDFNHHVNNAKYIGWILECVPDSLALGHKISSLTLEYRRECAQNDVLQSLVAVSPANANNNSAVYETDQAQSQHLIRLEDGADILRAMIEWRLRK